MTRVEARRRVRSMGRLALLATEYDDVEQALGRPLMSDPPRVRRVPKCAPEPSRRPRIDPVVVL